MLRKLALVLGMFAVAAPAVRGDVVIDFESFTGMSNIPGSPVPSASQLSAQLLTTDGVVFSSDSPFVAVVDFGGGTASGINGIGGVNASGDLDYGASIDAAFFLPASPATLAVTNFVSVRADLIGLGGLITLQAFDINGSLLTTDTEVDTDGPTLLVSAAGIHSVRFFGSTATEGFDDFSFGPLQAAQAVPEPACLAMLGSGVLCLLGFSRRRRRLVRT